GVKKSSTDSFKEQGPGAIEFYTKVKSVIWITRCNGKVGKWESGKVGRWEKKKRSHDAVFSSAPFPFWSFSAWPTFSPAHFPTFPPAHFPPVPLRPRMVFIVPPLGALRGDMGIDLRRYQVGVAEQFLHAPQIGPGVKEVRGKTVTQLVGSEMRVQAR